MTDTTTELPPRAVLAATPIDALRQLPAIGRLMVILRANGVTHERIGAVEAVNVTGEQVTLSGDCHDARIDAAALARVEIDRSSVMNGKSFPRLEFLDGAGEVVLAVVGMGGAEPFEAALADLGQNTITAPEKPDSEKRADLAEDDAALAPFLTLQDKGAEVVIAMSRAGFDQQWRGVIEAVKPAMGFLNVMTADFHLHLAGGTVSGWRDGQGEKIALGEGGTPTGLRLISQAFA